VRQVFLHRVFRPKVRQPADEIQISAGLEVSAPVLGALENLANGQVYLVGTQVTLGDFHLAAMIDYFTVAEEGGALLGGIQSCWRGGPVWRNAAASRKLGRSFELIRIFFRP
jgi:glutathione S-transferase